MRNYRRITIALVLVAMASSFAQFGAVASLNDVARHFGHHSDTHSLQSVVGLSGSVLGIALAILRLASLLALPLTARADRRGRVHVLTTTLWIGLLVTALASLSPTYWVFVACFAVARPLLSTSSTLVQVITVELSSTARRVSRLALMAAGAGAGAGLSAILHGAIRGSNSFRWLFVVALVPLAFVPLVTRFIPEPAERSPGTLVVRLGAIAREWRPRLYVVGVVSFIIGVISGPANGFAFVYGEGLLKLAPRFVATVVTASAFTGLTGLFSGRYLAQRFGRRWTVAAGVVASALTACLAYSGGHVAFVVGYMSGVFSAGLLAPAAAALGTEIFPHRVRATAAGWIVVAGVIGATCGLFVFGWVADSVRATVSQSLRVPSLVTFLPLLPTLWLLRRLPESVGVDID